MKKPFVTREGYDLLSQELRHLWEDRRPEVTQKVAWAASLGDRSENADYQYNKRLLGQIDRRVRFLRGCLQRLKVIEYNRQQEGRVFFGAYVEIESNDEDAVMRLRIVGGDEIFGRSNCISVDSPLAKALLGKSEGDDAEVMAPRGRRSWHVSKISYRKPSWFEDEEPQLRDLGADDLEVEVEEIPEEERRRLEQEYLSTLVK
ncbi:MAG: transcription elongation factor GreB [Succinivibrionaceae bacterium]|nr:transcription elongation factor GreB [Succinivibrionaceae bacterium]